jgi:hypothetical protein
MDAWFVTLVLIFGLHALNRREQRTRIALLASHLGPLRLEKHMESYMHGCQRALAEAEPARQASLWSMLESVQRILSDQVHKLAVDFAKAPQAEALVSGLPLALPKAALWWPQRTWDMRAMLQLHDQALARAAEARADESAKDQAYRFMAELMLFQHSCHWFCRSRLVASARLLARHQTHYEQVLQAVDPATAGAYRALLR